MIDLIKALHAEQMHRWANQEQVGAKFSPFDEDESPLRNQLIGDVDFQMQDGRTVLRPSSSGFCIRKVVVKTMFGGMLPKQPFGPALQQGTQGHLWMDQGLKAVLHRLGGYASSIVPQQVLAYEFDSYKVEGTPDALIPIWSGPHKGKLLMPDYKFIAEYAYKKLFKEGAPEYYQMQVHCYMRGVTNWLRTIGLDFEVVPYIVHFNKGKLQDMKPIIIDGGNVPQRTKNYWQSVASACDDTIETGSLPPPIPEMKWECGYCDLGPNERCAQCSTFTELGNL